MGSPNVNVLSATNTNFLGETGSFIEGPEEFQPPVPLGPPLDAATGVSWETRVRSQREDLAGIGTAEARPADGTPAVGV